MDRFWRVWRVHGGDEEGVCRWRHADQPDDQRGLGRLEYGQCDPGGAGERGASVDADHRLGWSAGSAGSAREKWRFAGLRIVLAGWPPLPAPIPGARQTAGSIVHLRGIARFARAATGHDGSQRQPGPVRQRFSPVRARRPVVHATLRRHADDADGRCRGHRRRRRANQHGRVVQHLQPRVAGLSTLARQRGFASCLDEPIGRRAVDGLGRGGLLEPGAVARRQAHAGERARRSPPHPRHLYRRLAARRAPAPDV